MPEDASLDDFLDAGSGATDDDRETADDTDAAAEEGAAVEDPEHADAGRSTYDWSPAGAPCAACGDVVERRWRDDPGLVCEDCKEW